MHQRVTFGTAGRQQFGEDALRERVHQKHQTADDVFVCYCFRHSPNCNQHITPRFTLVEMAPTIQELQQRIAELEEQNATLRKQLPEGLAGPLVNEANARNVAPIFAETPTKGADCALS